jgi:hypothetical protein
MYKITSGGKTMVGSNFDAYYLTPKIWFENASEKGLYGSVFVGGRLDGSNGVAPQTGMNDSGLTFSRLVAAPPENGVRVSSGKKTITNPTFYLKDIIHNCKTVDEVRNYISQYDHSYFMNDVFLYIERSGRYLIVEPDTMTFGNDANYVLANFCPTQIQDFSTIKQVRYRNGVAFLKNKVDTSIAFCTAMSDTMHVCRKKVGDGTLATIIRDLNEGTLYLNFYHDYKHQVKFNLAEELAKGDHIFDMPSLFPKNAEFEKLYNYKTPSNNITVMNFMMFSFGLFFFSFLFFLVSYLRKRKTASYSSMKLILASLSLFLMYYVLVLVKNENIFYFPAPYKDYKFSLVNIASYIPMLLLLLIIPLYRTNRHVFKQKSWPVISRWLFAINNLTYSILIILFAYWGLYNFYS